MRFFCTNCPRSYKYKQDLKRHQTLECGKEPQFSCPFCPKKCKRKTHLRNHVVNKHKSVYVDIFKMHMSYWEKFNSVPDFGYRIETYNAVYCPNNCGRKYKHKHHLNRHLKYECGVRKQFVCDECGRSFAHKCNLKNHSIIVHKKII
ncbi:hypothetical protein PGB90_007327 [Kerria lacca]